MFEAGLLHGTNHDDGKAKVKSEMVEAVVAMTPLFTNMLSKCLSVMEGAGLELQLHWL